MPRTTLYLPPDLHDRLQAEAQRTGRSQSELMRAALASYLNDEARPMPRSIGMADDPELSAVGIDDWLRENWRPA
jgi:predicted transcriptional regulator